MREREHVLQLENITMQFGGVVAVNNLSLEVNKGEIVALIGPNGAGKTTAFNVITGVYQPTNGQALFHDKVYLRNHPQGKMKKGYKGENGLLYTSEYKLEGQKTKEEEKQRDHYVFSNHVLAPTPDHITKMGIARTFQNIRLWKSMTVFDNVIIAKHMRAKHNVFSSTFRISRKEEARMREETEALLREQGFDVVSVICKTGGFEKELSGIPKEGKIHPEQFEPMCNPIAQARLLNSQKTEFNIALGLCVGHDSMFYKYSEALVTTLVAKDRVLAHNPCGAIYCADGYFKQKLRG